MNYLIGADPEYAVVNSFGDFVSAHDLIPGTKEYPHILKSGLGAIQVDGTMAEFNIQPAITVEDFCNNIETVKKELLEYLPKDYSIIGIPTVHFSKEYFDSLPDDPKLLGCMPDFNAWTGEQNVPPDANDVLFRTGAGHVHVGWTEFQEPFDPEHFLDCRDLAKQLDCILYPMSLLWDDDTTRRTLYGNLGAFRPKSYGMEYRCLSNVWVNEPKLQEWVFNTTRKAVEDMFKGIRYLDAPECQDLCTRLLGATTGTDPLAGKEGSTGNTCNRDEILEYQKFMVKTFRHKEIP